MHLIETQKASGIGVGQKPTLNRPSGLVFAGSVTSTVLRAQTIYKIVC